MSWMEWTLAGVMIFCAVFFAIVVIVSYLEGWRWRK